MSTHSLSRKITGLSAEKWTMHQLKALQYRMQPSATTKSSDLPATVKDILAMFSFGNADSCFANRKVLKSLSAELLSDLIKTLTAFNCITESATDIDTKKLSFQLSDEIFATFSEVTANSTEAVVAEVDESTTGLRQASSLGILANLGTIGFEDSATMLLDSLNVTVTKGMDHTDLTKFTVSYLQFLQTVMNFHSNRKKLFTNICEVLLPSVMRLLSHCNVAHERGDDSLVALQSVLSDVIEKGLFDEKNVEELATLQLSTDIASAGANSSKHAHKKQKGNEPQGDGAGVDSSAKAKSDIVKNKSFHDTLFRILESRYNAPATESEAAEPPVENTDNVIQFAQSYASGVACLYKVYCTKSASMALQASSAPSNAVSFQSRGSFHSNNNARNDVLGTDAVNTRKHLIRVFHFLFQLIDAFRVNGENSMDSLIATLEERARVKKTDTETTATPGKKRKQDKVASGAADSNVAWSVEMVRLLKARVLRNAVLSACVEIVNQQAIPNHDSLYRYVELLVALSVQSVKDCVKLNVYLESAADAQEVAHPDAEFAHALLTADLVCVRLVALIDHTTVVDHRLPSVVEILGAPDCTGAPTDVCRPQWIQKHHDAKRDLFHVVLRVHGELRLLDQLVGQLTKLDGQQAALARLSMLHTIVSSSQVAQTLVKLFSAAPVGQLPQHWANLSGIVTTNGALVVAPTPNACVGVLTCALARALMEAQLHTVRSNISVFSAEAASSADQIDANTVHMTVLLWRLATTVQGFVSGQNSGKANAKGFDVALMQGVMSTLSVLLRFVAHFHAGTMKQLTVPCLTTSADSTKQTSFHSVAMGLLLNNLTALRLNDSCFVPVFKALLSLVLLNSNITAKVPTAQKDFSAQTTILSKYTLDLLAGAGAEFAESTKLDLLYLVLCDIRVWSQFVRKNDADAFPSSPMLQPKQLVPLFQTYIRAGAQADADSATETDVSQRLNRIAGILQSPAVTDNKFLRMSAHSALQAEWLAADAIKSSKKSDPVASRTALLIALYRLFGADFLYSATFFVPSIFAHLVATSLVGGGIGSEMAAGVLLGHLRIVPSERASSQISAYPTKPSVLDAALYFMTGAVHSSDEVSVKVLGNALDQLYGLTRAAMQQEEDKGEAGNMLALVSLLMDALLSRLVQQFNVDESPNATAAVSSALAFIKEIAVGSPVNVHAQKALLHTALSCFVSTPVRKLENSAVKNVNPSDPLVVSALHEIVATLSQRLLKEGSETAGCADADLYSLGEAVVVISAMVQKSDQNSLTDSAQSDVIRAMFQHAAAVLRDDASSTSAGWLYLFGSLSDQILLRFGVVTLPQITEMPTADMYLPITINLAQLGFLCDVVQRMLARELTSSTSELSAVESTALSMPVVSLLTSLLNAGLNSRMCNCEPHQMLAVLKSHLLQPLQAGSTAARSFAPVLCRDVLIYFTEHGRKLLPGGKLAQDKFQQFHESLIELTVSTYQDIIASHRGQTAEDVNQLAALLYHTNCVTATVSSVLQRQGRGGARRKNKENDTKSTLFRCDLWFDGLLSTITLITSHMHMWQESSGAVSNTTESLSALDCNASTVLLAKSLLQNMERLVAVSTSSSLPNLNTAIGAIILAITSTVTLLLRIENAVVATSSPAAVQSASAVSVTQALTLNLNSCYHLICRVFSSIASSQVLEKHVHFIACAAVESLSKATVSRSFQEVAYPGIYALFEKCQSRQKTQMFAMLDAQSRTLMTDLHNEFMRSFKFVGK